MKQIDKNRFHLQKMASNYDKMCQMTVPGYDFLQEAVIDILKFENMDNIVLLDLGAGSGILIEKVLKAFPDSVCYYLDFSDEFMSIAKERLQKYEDRVNYIKSDFCRDWESKIAEKPTVITSMSAIHHLQTENKKKLYKKCYDALKEDGWFFNIDEMKTMTEDAYLKSLYYWVYHAEKQKYIIPDDLSISYDAWMEKFSNWKKRNINNIHLPKQEGDDIHESFLTQLDWLKKIGFTRTDIFSKHLLWCLIGGKKAYKDV
jgi:tRNA (cmo5U34)-methyltransferase